MLSFPRISINNHHPFPPFVELSLKTSPPVAVIGSDVHRITRAELVGSDAAIRSIQPDDARMHDTVSEFNSVYHAGNTLYFRFDPDSPLTLFGHGGVVRLVLHLSIHPLSLREIAAVTTHNKHRETTELTCAICMTTERCCCDDDAWTTLDCDHRFHTACIRRWLFVRNTCPMCRGRVF